MLIVRLTDSGTNSSPSSTAWELGDNIFSSSGISLMERFASCSKNKFTIEKMTGSALTNGVLDVTSTIPLNGSDETCASQGEQLADSAISAGTIDSDDYDYVLVICPKNVDFGVSSSFLFHVKMILLYIVFTIISPIFKIRLFFLECCGLGLHELLAFCV